ncbi:hypothetical protein BH09VER1_BH09VER1_49210 [soil metagenome]
MDSPQLCTVGQLADMLAGCPDEIVTEWRRLAGELLKDLKLDRPTLTDHMPDIVAEITRDLSLGREGELSAEHTRGSPPVHGVQRFHDGLEVDEVVAEYNLLRSAFVTVAERHGLYVAGRAAHIINHRLDQAVRLAVSAFAEQQTLLQKEQQEDHLAFIAHDLRTPLFAASLIVSTLEEGLAPEELASSGDLFPALRRNLRRVEELIKRVLESNIQPLRPGGAFRPERRLFDLWPLVQRLIIDLTAVSSERGVTVVNEIPRSLAVLADAGLLSQVFQNLLTNSFHYAPQGRIVVSAREEEGGVTCTVRDDGDGIEPGMLDKIFDKLVTDPAGEGTGLGLAIVKQIVEAHGGVVRAESALGNGATFIFTLPGMAD